jgi:predicted nucleic acid-binding protein
MILYVDTSALVKRYVVEDSSEEVLALIEQAEVVGTVVLTRVEMASALGKAVRQGWIERETALKAWQDFAQHWLSFTRLNISPAMINKASDVAWDLSLRGYDAVHFAAMSLWQETLGMPIILMTYDNDLWKAGMKTGIRVWPDNLIK